MTRRLPCPTPRSASVRRIATIAVQTLLPVLGMALATAGLLGVLSFAVLPLVELLRTRHWVPVPATVESVTLRPPRMPLHPPLDSLEISYRYSLDGATHQGARVDLQDGLYEPQAGSATVAALSGSPAITVWVNPAAPEQAIVYRAVRWRVFVLAVPALAMLAIGVVMVYRGMLLWTTEREARRSADDAD